MELSLEFESVIRLGFFLGVFGLMALWETLWPRRPRFVRRWIRWPNNLAIVGLNNLLLRVAFPTTAVGLAMAGTEKGWGLLNNFDLPDWAAVVLSVIVLDLAIYLQHVMLHAVPVFWRIHRMHHADLDFDVTTGSRFHPIEIFLSMAFKFMIIVTLGASALSVFIFEILLNATSMFNHSNVCIHARIDRILRRVIVTPDMHRVHHSILPRETNSNFGFNVPWWDRLFGTYLDQPADGHEHMTIGIEQFRTSRELWLDRMLIQPFRSKVGHYPIGRRGTAG
ncbi:sterol desaturase family protein [Methylocaldum sp. BRCS4]|jgi:sterol desaturase/sphingolipid hydroxylase (fatty acid hydroxylase superfamily)|uniref:sterol desaturase family protein n=1 Tax=Methylocaldum sp. 14B TaxID=1912213 RepID=UPI000989F13F|nr:sterol desaturase family protein [Methylocaldum sp. 14B]MVF23062.1 sterol desaturase family protein [Methylocaldum sp. BRCS4]